MQTNHPPKLFVWAVGAAIVILANLLFHYAIALVYAEPKFENFCPIQNVQYNDANTCVTAGGQWTNNNYAPSEITAAVKNGQPLGYCDVNFTCNKHYNDAHSIYNRNVFGILVVLGIVSVIIGAFMAIEVLAIGFSWAGVVALIIASMQYWSDANNLIRVIILAFALGLVIWLAVKKFGLAKTDHTG